MLGVPVGNRRRDLIDGRRDAVVGLGEERDQRAVEHVPVVAVADLGDAVAVQDPPARLASVLAIERLHQRRAAAAHAVAVDVEDLDRIVRLPVAGQVLVGRCCLVPVLDDRRPEGLAPLLVAHPGLHERLDDILDGRHVVDLVGEHLQLVDPPAAVGRTVRRSGHGQGLSGAAASRQVGSGGASWLRCPWRRWKGLSRPRPPSLPGWPPAGNDRLQSGPSPSGDPHFPGMSRLPRVT